MVIGLKRSKEKDTQFKFKAPQAKKVSVGGSFNNWNPNAFLAKKDSKGNWSVTVGLTPGTYEYKFYVDGAWMTDPACKKTVNNPFGSVNSVVEVK